MSNTLKTSTITIYNEVISVVVKCSKNNIDKGVPEIVEYLSGLLLTLEGVIAVA